MARPTKWRKIENVPDVTCFLPSLEKGAGIPGNPLKLEELEGCPG